jgi:type I restriction enzyme S subunit
MNTKALRQKILDLAIHGKLVPQNPKDESATVLLEKIRAEKTDKIKKGELKADKKDSFIFVGSDKRHYEQFADGTVKDIEDEIPFEVPEGWAWCRLNELADIARGGSPRPIENYITDSPDGINWIKIGDTAPESKYIESAKEKIKPEGEKHSRFVHKGDFLLTNSMSFGRPYILKINGCIHDGWLVFANIKDCIIKDYLYYALSSDYIYNSFSMVAAGSTVKNLKSDTVKQVLFPLPPTKTQKKIIESIEKSFLQIDILDKEKADLETAIKQARSKILDLAIHGRLVPQDPNDEPAEELLKRIATSDNRPYKKFAEEKPFDIPKSWAWCTGNDLFNSMTSKKPDGETFRYIDIDAIDNKKHCVIEPKSLSVSEAPSRASRELNNGDVLFSLVRPYLENIALIEEENSDCIASTGFYVCKPKSIILPKFLFYLMTTDYVIKGLNQFMKGDNSPSVSGDDIKNWLYPLPPLAEQRRIVTKIENLFNQLDSIQNELIS